MRTRFVPRRAAALLATVVGAALVASCGGSNGTPAPYAQYAGRCAAPRAGVDQRGTLTDEKNWLRTWTNDLYLWYREVPAVDPNAYATAIDYFQALKTIGTNQTGTPKDKFHFTMSTVDWLAFSQSGVLVSYGIEFIALVASSPNRDVRVGFVAPNSPAAAVNITRGAQVMKIDGQSVSNGDANVLNAGLGPSAASPTHSFEFLFPDGTTHDLPLTASSFTEDPVPIAQVFPGTHVGYILFTDHIQTAESELVNAIKTLKSAQVTDLVLDIRYNGGGYLAIADELAYMISGPGTAGKTFERITFNDQHPSFDPVTGASLAPIPFVTTGQNFTVRSNVLLPTLGLSRVFVLTGRGTCSASESIINGLTGVGVNVVQIGQTTCGKPYGFYPADNCGTTYFSIEFQGVNAKGFGSYSDGFVPGGTGTGVAGLPGCVVAEDFSHQLGDPADARVVAAMNWAASPGTCPPPPPAPAAQQQTALSAAALGDAIQAKPPWRENRILVNER